MIPLLAAPALGAAIPVSGFGSYAGSQDGSTCGLSVSGAGVFFTWGEELSLPTRDLGPSCFGGASHGPNSIASGSADIGSISSDFFTFGIGGDSGSQLTLYNDAHFDTVLATAELQAYYSYSSPVYIDPFDLSGTITVTPNPEPGMLWPTGLACMVMASYSAWLGKRRISGGATVRL